MRRIDGRIRAGFHECGGLTALCQVFADNQSPLTRSAISDRLVGKAILSRCGLVMFQNLCGRRLPHIRNGELFQVVWQNLRRIRAVQRPAQRRGETSFSSLHDASSRRLEEAETVF
jgi:hypothetical protein